MEYWNGQFFVCVSTSVFLFFHEVLFHQYMYKYIKSSFSWLTIVHKDSVDKMKIFQDVFFLNERERNEDEGVLTRLNKPILS